MLIECNSHEDGLIVKLCSDVDLLFFYLLKKILFLSNSRLIPKEKQNSLELSGGEREVSFERILWLFASISPFTDNCVGTTVVLAVTETNCSAVLFLYF